MSTDPHGDDDLPLDLAQARAILGDLDRAGGVRHRLQPDSRLLFGVWGVAWLVGYLTLWTSMDRAAGTAPPAWAFVIFSALIAGATIATVVHVTVRSKGVRGASATTGTMYGLAWAVSFTVVGMILGGLAQLDLPGDTMGLISNALPCLVVGALYMAGAATYREWAWFGLGVWIAVVAGVATLVGMPHTYLVMAIAGGAVMLGVALASHLVTTIGRRQGRSS